MRNIDKLHRIKDFLNRVLKEVYNISNTGLITHLIEEDADVSIAWYGTYYNEINRMFGDSKVEYSVAVHSTAIIYNRQTFHIIPQLGRGMSAVRALYKIFGVEHSDIHNGLRISTIYDKILPLSKYSTEELKLYFKLLLL